MLHAAGVSLALGGNVLVHPSCSVKFRKGSVELRPAQDLSRGRRKLCRPLRQQLHTGYIEIEANARGLHPALLRGFCVGAADGRVNKVRQNRGLGCAIHVGSAGAVVAERSGDGESAAGEIG
jgi:hypothetical protein